MELLIVSVMGLLTVAASTALAPRVRLASPLVLVVLGIGVSFLPFVPAVRVDPQWILLGVLPPLLYSASVAMPTMNFRRELTSISGLAVVLVVVSSLVLGLFFAWAVPDLGIWWGIALGAIISPTDAVATSIVKQVGVSGRVTSVLTGESLLNDASALVLLRTAIAGSAAAVPLWQVAGGFVYAVAVAVAFGGLVGWANLKVRARVTNPTVNTIITFTVPFLASVPSDLLGASGLVAAVVAGLVTGHGAPRQLPVQHRVSDTQNWEVVELVLEGAIFLLMGLELYGIVTDVGDADRLGEAFVIAGGALGLLLLVRAGYVAQLLVVLRSQDRRRPRAGILEDRAGVGPGSGFVRALRSATPSQDPARRSRRRQADIEYFRDAPLGWRDGGILTWSGMRGAVTVAAAQTLPADTPNRSLLVLIAFVVAAASLLLQGGTLSAFTRWILPASPSDDGLEEERRALLHLLADVRRDIVREIPESELPVGTALDWATADPEEMSAAQDLAMRIVDEQRATLLDARDDGTFNATVLTEVLEQLDATKISIELRTRTA